jgi:hypothetical protein
MTRRYSWATALFGTAIVAAACGGSSNTGANGDGGGGDAVATSSGGSSGAGSSGGTSSGSSGANGGASSGTTSGGGGGGWDGGPVSNDCPNCTGSQICCLTNVGGQVQGTCAANAAACPSGAGALQCAGAGDCNTGETCCVSGGSASAPASTTCTTSCTTGRPGCGGSPQDNMDCPGGGAGWTCEVIPGTPSAVLGVCVPADSGAPSEGGGSDSGSQDAAGGG